MIYQFIPFLQSEKATGLFQNEIVWCTTPVSNILKTSAGVQSPYCIDYRLLLCDIGRGKSDMLCEKMILVYVRKVKSTPTTGLVALGVSGRLRLQNF